MVTRFAPSPTGYLHVGGARTALFNWLLARHHQGKFLLRIEDTDRARSTQQAVDQLLEDLKWLGLHWDNEQLIFQSTRLETYNAIIDELISRELAYKAYESHDELASLRQAAEREKRGFTYRRRPLPEAQARQFEFENRPHVVRLAMPVKEHRFRDLVLGKDVVMPAEEAQDFVIRKGDGMPTYHFAVVVDDQAMGVTHVLRAQEHLKNTFYHIALMDALNYPWPTFGHLPIIMNVDGSKMGKRDRDKKVRHHANLWLKKTGKAVANLALATGVPEPRLAEWLHEDKKQLDPSEHNQLMPVIGLDNSDLPEILVHDFRANGYLPEVLLNFLALLGWSPGQDRERMSMEEMVGLFSIDGIGKANAKFARDKLLAFNTDACAAAPPDRLLSAFKDFLSVNPDSPLHRAGDDQLAMLLQMKKGFRTLREVEQTTEFLFRDDEQIDYQPDAVDKVLRKNNGEGAAVLREIREVLAGVADWRQEPIEQAIQGFCTARNLGLGKVAQPIRIALTGGTISPPIFQSLQFLGRKGTLARIDRCLILNA
jgi:glutamyl/glutaminyl-tRNA synthetase